MDRRALLTKASMLTAAGTAATLALPKRAEAAGLTAMRAYDVKDYGALGNGTTDDKNAIQAAINAAAVAGGLVFFPPGVYNTSKLTLKSKAHLRGSGIDATTLRLKNASGANSAILESYDFANAVRLFSVRDMTLDGNKVNNTSGYGIRIFGYGYELSELAILDCKNDGIHSEWSNVGEIGAPSHEMEARISGVKTHDNDQDGINFRGPHDSLFINCVSFRNKFAGFRLRTEGTAVAAGTHLVNCHAWGAAQDTGFQLEARAIGCLNCYGDLDGGVGVKILDNECQWIGGRVIGSPHTPEVDTEVGIQIGDTTHAPSGTIVDTYIQNCHTGAVDFANDPGSNVIRALVYQELSDGTPLPSVIGAPNATSRIEVMQKLGDVQRNLVVLPAFDLREQAASGTPAANSARIFARDQAGKTQLCVQFATGAVQVVAQQP